MQKCNQHQFDIQLSEAYRMAKKQLPLSNGWKESNKNKKLGLINHIKKDEQFEIPITRAEGIIHVSLNKLLEILQDLDAQNKIDSRMKSSKLICKTNSNNEIRQQIFSPPIGNDRESIIICGVVQEDNATYLVMTSVDHPDYVKAGKGMVRCIHYYWAYQIVQLSENSCNVVMISCLDPKGNFPNFLKNKMNASRGIEKLEQIIEYIKNK